MKKQINEIKRMQQLAGIIKEYVEDIHPDDQKSDLIDMLLFRHVSKVLGTENYDANGPCIGPKWKAIFDKFNAMNLESWADRDLIEDVKAANFEECLSTDDVYTDDDNVMQQESLSEIRQLVREIINEVIQESILSEEIINKDDFRETNKRKDFAESEIKRSYKGKIEKGVLFTEKTKSKTGFSRSASMEDGKVYKVEKLSDKPVFGGNKVWTCIEMKKVDAKSKQ
jgi:hypothetical protein